jgi:hypothetical protein
VLPVYPADVSWAGALPSTLHWSFSYFARDFALVTSISYQRTRSSSSNLVARFLIVH